MLNCSHFKYSCKALMICTRRFIKTFSLFKLCKSLEPYNYIGSKQDIRVTTIIAAILPENSALTKRHFFYG